jgi:hypothetical protein
MQELIEDVRERPGYIPPTLEQSNFADRVVLLTQDRGDSSLAKMFALAYAEWCLVGNMSEPLIDAAARLKVLIAINQEDNHTFLAWNSVAA